MAGSRYVNLDIAVAEMVLRRLQRENCYLHSGKVEIFFRLKPCVSVAAGSLAGPRSGSGLRPSRVLLLWPLVFGAGRRSHLGLETASRRHN